jgi:hypothetical protein
MANRKDVFTIIDKGENARPFWLKIGAAFECKDGSFNVVLDALPVDGRLHIRDAETRESEPEAPPAHSDPRAPRR